MVMDKFLPIKNLSPSGYELALKALKGELTDGRYDLENGAYAFLSTYVTKPISEGLYEAHKEYTDVQLIVDGVELIGVTGLEKMHSGVCVKEYEYDIELYKVEGGELHELKRGEFLILTSSDAHMPGISHTPAETRKLVIKIPEKK